MKEVHVAGDLQEESLHSGVLSLLKPCGIDATLKFYGHNNLFSEKKDKVEINTLVGALFFFPFKNTALSKTKQTYFCLNFSQNCSHKWSNSISSGISRNFLISCLICLKIKVNSSLTKVKIKMKNIFWVFFFLVFNSSFL